MPHGENFVLVFTFCELPNQGPHLLQTDGGENLEPVGGQDFNGGDSAEAAPVVPIRGPHEIRVVVPEALGYEETGAVGEHDVVLGQAFFGCGRGRHHENRPGAEPEKHNRTVPVRDVGESPVDGFVQEVEMADEWERGERGRRQVSDLVEEVLR